MMRKLRISLTLLLGLLPAALLAGSLPGHYPDHFNAGGTVDSIDLNSRTLVVGDLPRQVADNVRVHELSGGLTGLSQLRTGMEIGYSTVSDRGRGGLIDEIWILPRGYLDRHRARPRY